MTHLILFLQETVVICVVSVSPGAIPGAIHTLRIVPCVPRGGGNRLSGWCRGSSLWGSGAWRKPDPTHVALGTNELSVISGFFYFFFLFILLIFGSVTSLLQKGKKNHWLT